MERNRLVLAAITKVLDSLEAQKQFCLVPGVRWSESGNFGREFFFCDEQSAYITYFGTAFGDDEYIKIEVPENHQDDRWIQVVSQEIQETIKRYCISSIHSIECSFFKREGDNYCSAGRGIHFLWKREPL